VTTLFNSRAGGHAAAVIRHGTSLDLASMPDKPLELTTSDELDQLAELIARMTSWPWIGASTTQPRLKSQLMYETLLPEPRTSS
jgi:hypothetical protein